MTSSGNIPSWLSGVKEKLEGYGYLTRITAIPDHGYSWKPWWKQYFNKGIKQVLYIEEALPKESGLYVDSHGQSKPNIADCSQISIFYSKRNLGVGILPGIRNSYLQQNSMGAELIVKIAGLASSASDNKQETILDSIPYSDYPQIAKVLEARLSMNEVKESIAQNTLLHLATIEQRLGNLDKARNILETLIKKDSGLNPSIILLRGKIETQAGASLQRIRQIISELDEPKFETTEAERNKVKSSLLWRLATIEAAQGNKEWERSLQQQLELSIAPYLLAHNQQCFSMIGVNTSSISGNNPEKHRDGLLVAFTGYIDIPDFSFLEQCVASNFIFQGYAHSLQGHMIQKYKAILAARVLFERSKVHKQTEAIVEVLGLLGEDKEEIVSLLFEDINKLVARHKHGDLIADCYYEVYLRIASDRSVDVISDLMDEVT